MRLQLFQRPVRRERIGVELQVGGQPVHGRLQHAAGAVEAREEGPGETVQVQAFDLKGDWFVLRQGAFSLPFPRRSLDSSAELTPQPWILSLHRPY